jgi:hypothetical protein
LPSVQKTKPSNSTATHTNTKTNHLQKPPLAKNNLHNPPDKPPPTIPASAFICAHLRLKNFPSVIKQNQPIN